MSGWAMLSSLLPRPVAAECSVDSRVSMPPSLVTVFLVCCQVLYCRSEPEINFFEEAPPLPFLHKKIPGSMLPGIAFCFSSP